MVGLIPPQWITLELNTLVHVFMYYYYLVQSLGQDVWWKKYVTTMQIVQFVLDVIVIGQWFLWKYLYGYNCSGSLPGISFAMAILLYFLFLFSQFFIKTYRKGNKKSD